MWDCPDKVKEYFFNPKNAGLLADANAVGEAGALTCGDALKLMLKIDPMTDVIDDARFQAFGCGSAIASSSAVTEMIVGKTVDEARAITNADIADFLGGLPPEKMHCSVMGYEALRTAIARYRGEDRGDVHDDSVRVCECFGVDEGVIERAVRANKLTSPEQVTLYTKAGGGCHACCGRVEEVLARVNGDMADQGLISAGQAYRGGTADPAALGSKARVSGANGKQVGGPHLVSLDTARSVPRQSPLAPKTVAGAAGKLTTLQKIKLIEAAIDDLRPYLQRDGGDCQLVDVEDNRVLVRLSGACIDCQMASVTISGVQERLVQKLCLPLRVVPVR